MVGPGLKPWHMGTHLRVLSESHSMNTNITGDFGRYRPEWVENGEYLSWNTLTKLGLSLLTEPSCAEWQECSCKTAAC